MRRNRFIRKKQQIQEVRVVQTPEDSFFQRFGFWLGLIGVIVGILSAVVSYYLATTANKLANRSLQLSVNDSTLNANDKTQQVQIDTLTGIIKQLRDQNTITAQQLALLIKADNNSVYQNRIKEGTEVQQLKETLDALYRHANDENFFYLSVGLNTNIVEQFNSFKYILNLLTSQNENPLLQKDSLLRNMWLGAYRDALYIANTTAVPAQIPGFINSAADSTGKKYREEDQRRFQIRHIAFINAVREYFNKRYSSYFGKDEPNWPGRSIQWNIGKYR